MSIQSSLKKVRSGLGIALVGCLLLSAQSCHRSTNCPAYPGHANSTVSMSKFSKGKKAHEKKNRKFKTRGREKNRTRRRLFKSRY